MKLLVLTSEPITGRQLRDALGTNADPAEAEVMVVAPAFAQSALRFWMSDADEAIAKADAVRRESMQELGEAGISATGDTGEADPHTAAPRVVTGGAWRGCRTGGVAPAYRGPRTPPDAAGGRSNALGLRARPLRPGARPGPTVAGYACGACIVRHGPAGAGRMARQARPSGDQGDQRSAATGAPPRSAPRCPPLAARTRERRSSGRVPSFAAGLTGSRSDEPGVVGSAREGLGAPDPTEISPRSPGNPSTQKRPHHDDTARRDYPNHSAIPEAHNDNKPAPHHVPAAPDHAPPTTHAHAIHTNTRLQRHDSSRLAAYLGGRPPSRYEHETAMYSMTQRTRSLSSLPCSGPLRILLISRVFAKTAP
jgi:hypothetical protein